MTRRSSSTWAASRPRSRSCRSRWPGSSAKSRASFPTAKATERVRDGKPYRTDNGNAILDCAFGTIADPRALAAAVQAIHGVLDVGIFLDLADAVLCTADEGVRELTKAVVAKLSANLSWLFTERPLRERFAAAAACGFRAVEILWPYELPADEIAAELRANDLELVLLNFPAGDMSKGERGFAARPGDEGRFEAGLDLALAYAETTGCPRLHAMSGTRLDGVPLAAHEDTLVANLTAAAPRCADAGITLTIEPLNAKENPAYALQSTAQAIAILDRVAQPNVALQFDFYHVFHTEGHAIERAHELRGRFAHVQIAGCPDRHEPNTGALNITAALAQLDADNYPGYIGLEYKPATTTEAGLSWTKPYL